MAEMQNPIRMASNEINNSRLLLEEACVLKFCWAMVSSSETEIGMPLCSEKLGLIIINTENCAKVIPSETMPSLECD